jgi:hypothetical protein
MRMRTAKLALLTCMAGLTIAANTIAATAGTINLSDASLSGTITNVGGNPSGGFAPPGDTVSATTCASCGNLGSAGLVGAVSNNSYTGTNSAGIAVFDSALTYNPGAQGSIISITASADKSNTSSTGNSFQIVISQGGNYYLDSVSEPIVSGVFQSISVSGLTASDFSQICLVSCGTGNYANPGTFDLSPDTAVALNLTDGGAIEFGVLFTAHPPEGSTNTQIYDNLNFTLTTTPLPSTWTMLIGGIIGLGFLVSRRKGRGTDAIVTG